MRGLHRTLAAVAGSTSHAVARALGHTSFAFTKRHYVQREALEAAQRSASLAALRVREGLTPAPRNTKAPGFPGAPECEEGESNPHGVTQTYH